MKKTTKGWLIAAAALVLVGAGLFAGVMTANGWNFAKLSTVRYETHTYEIDESFRNLSLTTDTADIAFVPSDDGKCRVTCREPENARYTVVVEADTLVIGAADARTWYDSVGFHFDAPKITVALPESTYGALTVRGSTGGVNVPQDFAFATAELALRTGSVDFCAPVSESVKIETTTGDIRVACASAGSIALSTATGEVTVSGAACRDLTVGVSTGQTYLTDIACQNVVSAGTTGDIALARVKAAHAVSIERSTGNVTFRECDAAELRVTTKTGSVTGSLLTDKVFVTDTATGSVTVPQTTVGGKCEIRTGTGDIKIEIA